MTKQQSFPPRTWTRGMWRWWYREQRIQARESMKAVMDVVLYGAGFVRIGATGVHHVPYHEVIAV